MCFYISIVDARENPFFPSLGEKDLPYTTTNVETKPSLKRATIELPSYARVIKKVTIEYENLDASTETKSVELDNSIDWHLPIFISQNYMINSPKKVKKQVKFSLVASIKYAKFFIDKNKLKIITKDKMLRNFLLVSPHRIVLDFARDTSLKTYVKMLNNEGFKKIRVGNHNKYYRVVIELDGIYNYDYKKISGGYLFKLR